MNSNDGVEILKLAESSNLKYNEVDALGKISEVKNYIDIHIDQVLSLNIIDVNKIKSSNFKIVVDAVNSTGGIAVPKLLNKLGVEVIELYCEPNGHFPHNPEPLKENQLTIKTKGGHYGNRGEPGKRGVPGTPLSGQQAGRQGYPGSQGSAGYRGSDGSVQKYIQNFDFSAYTE